MTPKLVLNALKALFSKDYLMAKKSVFQFLTNVKLMMLLGEIVPLVSKVTILLMATVSSHHQIMPNLLI